MEKLFNSDGSPTPLAVESGLIQVPVAVMDTCERKGIPIETLRFDTLCGFYYPTDGWKGIFLGISIGGGEIMQGIHAHS